jgi:ribulose-5-phosphate 4-epimerase/fuculose-1-phosphate aldolase
MLPIDPLLREDLVVANHILAHEGVVDGFGHVSARAGPGHFILARSMAPLLVASTDILTFDLMCSECSGDSRTPYLERFIHAEIYRARTDVNAIVHSHSPATIPFGAVKGVRLQPIYHMSAFVGLGTPVFEIRDVGGNATDMLIRNRPLGEALAQALGHSALVLMRGHGATVVGTTLRQAVFRAVYTELNARVQMLAMGMGEVEYLNPAEAAAAMSANDGQIARAWDLWQQRAESLAANAR